MRRRNHDPLKGRPAFTSVGATWEPRQSVETFKQMTGDTYSSGIDVRPTTPADTTEICDLLEHGFGIAADGWRPLCTTNWLADNPPEASLSLMAAGSSAMSARSTATGDQRKDRHRLQLFRLLYRAGLSRSRLGGNALRGRRARRAHHLHLPHPRPGDTTGARGLGVCNPRPARVAVPAGAQCRNPLALACRHRCQRSDGACVARAGRAPDLR